MDLAYLLIVAKPGRRLGHREHELTTERDPRGLHLRPDQHVLWADGDGRVALGLWRSSRDPRTMGAWSAGVHGAAVTTGPVRVAGRPWAENGRWADECRKAVANAGDHAVDRLRGIFTLVCLDEAGAGLVVSDPLGLSFTYHGETSDIVAISSVGALVARAISRAGQRPRLDPLGVCGLAYSSYRIGDRTGFEGVHTTNPGTSVVVHPTAGAKLVESPSPWMSGHGSLEDPEAALDLIFGEISEAVTSSLSVPAACHIADLTGGKDSRLVLAAALHAGVADRFTFRSDGPRELPDVRVAADLASRVGVNHSARLNLPARDVSYAERLRRFVSASGGLTNAWDLKVPGERPVEVRLSGLNGECLRAHAMVEQPLLSDDDLVRYFDEVLRFGQLGLVRPSAARDYLDEALTLLLEDQPSGGDPLDRLESFQIRTRARARYGPLDELDRDHRILALYSIDAIRAAFSLGSWERQVERVHYELMRRVSPVLVEHPFAGPGWSSSIVSRPPEPGWAPTSAAGDPPRPKHMPLMAQLRSATLEERRSVHEAVLADQGNPAWELLDRQRTVVALGRAESLDHAARVELFGAITAALWLSQE